MVAISGYLEGERGSISTQCLNRQRLQIPITDLLLCYKASH